VSWVKKPLISPLVERVVSTCFAVSNCILSAIILARIFFFSSLSFAMLTPHCPVWLLSSSEKARVFLGQQSPARGFDLSATVPPAVRESCS